MSAPRPPPAPWAAGVHVRPAWLGNRYLVNVHVPNRRVCNQCSFRRGTTHYCMPFADTVLVSMATKRIPPRALTESAPCHRHSVNVANVALARGRCWRQLAADDKQRPGAWLSTSLQSTIGTGRSHKHQPWLPARHGDPRPHQPQRRPRPHQPEAAPGRHYGKAGLASRKTGQTATSRCQPYQSPLNINVTL